MTFVEFPQEQWKVAVNPRHVVMVSPMTDRRRHDPRMFNVATPVENKSVIVLCSPLDDGAFWITVDLPYEETLQKLREVA